jgi:hypothetical protein
VFPHSYNDITIIVINSLVLIEREGGELCTNVVKYTILKLEKFIFQTRWWCPFSSPEISEKVVPTPDPPDLA